MDQKDAQNYCRLFLDMDIFTCALVTGTLCSLFSKFLLGMSSTGMTGETELFSKPIIQILGMFLGMSLALVMHWAVINLKIPFPGYFHQVRDGSFVDHKGEPVEEPAAIPLVSFLSCCFRLTGVCTGDVWAEIHQHLC